MSSHTPLQGMELISCAQASAKQGVEQAAQQCGYGQNTKSFVEALEQACDEIGVSIHDLNDLIKNQDLEAERQGVIVAPDSLSEL